MIIIAEKLVAGGTCIGRIDGKAVFVPYALPGETLDIEITESRKDYSFARILSVLTPSPRRISPVCPLFGTCGGCSLQMADVDYQKELRLSVLGDCLARAHVDSVPAIEIVSGESSRYRSRFQFHRTADGKVGLKEGESNAIVPVGDCPVAVPAIRRALGDGSLAKEIRACQGNDRFHVFAQGENLWIEGRDTACTVRVSGETLSFDVRGFFQSNIPMLEKMVESVSRDLPTGGRLLDFYSGVGTFSLFAGTKFAETVLVEHNREALAVAARNLAGKVSKPVFCAVSDERWSRHPASRLPYNVAIVDPPRQGINKTTLDWFIASSLAELRYVSCDPVTFSRDAARLCAAGWRLKSVTLFDFYPQTHHIETFGIFSR
jgi:23S rRNA (uracil1939-C5)-methyltransferase